MAAILSAPLINITMGKPGIGQAVEPTAFSFKIRAQGDAQGIQE
jgi:hypothetical protein